MGLVGEDVMMGRRKAQYKGRCLMLVLAAVLGSVGIAACGGSSNGSGSGGTGSALTVAVPSGITTLNPILNGTGLPNEMFIQPAYASLITRTSTGTLQPGLATAWSYSDENKQFHLTLRPGVKFSNGQALTATGVADWIEWYKNSAGLFSSFFGDVAKVVVNGPLSLTMDLSSSDLKWPAIFTQDRLGFVICPAAIAKPAVLGTTTCGAGPYVYDASQSSTGTKYVYTPNPYYWDKPTVHWKKVVVEVLSDPNAVVSAMSSGLVNVAIGSSQDASAAKNAGLDVAAAPENWDAIAVINRQTSGPLSNAKVRQALEYAVNRPVVTKAVLGAYAVPNSSMTLPGIPGYSSSLGSQYTYNPAKARELLAAAGYPHGFSFTMMSIDRTGLENNLAQAVLPYLAAVGVQANLVVLPAGSAELVSGLETQKWPAFMFFGQVEAPNLLAQDQFLPTAGLLNPTKYVDAGLINLYNQYNGAPTAAEQSSALTELQNYVDERAYYITLSVSDVVYFHTTGVTGVNVSSGEPIVNLYTIQPAS
jgi:ABC-type transport system substrate-binding protein